MLDAMDLRQVLMGPRMWAAFVHYLSTEGLGTSELTALPWATGVEAPPVYRIVRVPPKPVPVINWTPEAIRAVRKAAGMTTIAFAAVLDVSRHAVHRWQSNTSGMGPGPDSQRRLSYFYHRLSPDDKSTFAALLLKDASELPP